MTDPVKISLSITTGLIADKYSTSHELPEDPDAQAREVIRLVDYLAAKARRGLGFLDAQQEDAQNQLVQSVVQQVTSSMAERGEPANADKQPDAPEAPGPEEDPEAPAVAAELEEAPAEREEARYITPARAVRTLTRVRRIFSAQNFGQRMRETDLVNMILKDLRGEKFGPADVEADEPAPEAAE